MYAQSAYTMTPIRNGSEAFAAINAQREKMRMSVYATAQEADRGGKVSFSYANRALSNPPKSPSLNTLIGLASVVGLEFSVGPKKQ
jgi:hypothetical protein